MKTSVLSLPAFLPVLLLHNVLSTSCPERHFLPGATAATAKMAHRISVGHFSTIALVVGVFIAVFFEGGVQPAAASFGAEVTSGSEFASCAYDSASLTWTCTDGDDDYGANENAVIRLTGPGEMEFQRLRTLAVWQGWLGCEDYIAIGTEQFCSEKWWVSGGGSSLIHATPSGWSVASGAHLDVGWTTNAGSGGNYAGSGSPEGFQFTFRGLPPVPPAPGTPGSVNVTVGSEFASCEYGLNRTWTCSDGPGSYGPNEHAVIELHGPGLMRFNFLRTEVMNQEGYDCDSWQGSDYLRIGTQAYCSRAHESAPVPAQTVPEGSVVSVEWKTDNVAGWVGKAFSLVYSLCFLSLPLTQPHFHQLSNGNIEGFEFTFQGDPSLQLPCPLGQERSHLSNCTPCSRGTYRSVLSAPMCAACAKGRYQDVAGSTNCNPCSAGKFVNAVGSTSTSQCQQCLAGSFAGVSGSEACLLCPEGTYESTTGRLVVASQICHDYSCRCCETHVPCPIHLGPDNPLPQHAVQAVPKPHLC